MRPLPWWRTLGDTRATDPERLRQMRSLAPIFARAAWRRRQHDAEPWTDLGGEG